MKIRTPIVIAGVLAGLSPLAEAQLIQFASDATLDRWMYPFNGTPGTRLSASTFGIPRLAGFDDHDAQFIVGFRTEPSVPTGLAPSSYRVISATVTATVTNDQQFRYDPTYDAHNTYENQEGSFPGLIPDSDPGRPIMLWGVGYRDGFSLATWRENSPFGFNPTVLPSQEARTAYIAVFDAAGVATDASNHLKAGIDLSPMAIGTTDTVAPGAFVPAPRVHSAVVVFEPVPGTRIPDAAIRTRFERLVKGAFQARRKTFPNAVKGLALDRDRVCTVLEDLGLDVRVRPEGISFAQYVEMSERLEELG
jgi:hypothetical protein